MPSALPASFNVSPRAIMPSTSLSRALAVRTYLLAQGVQSQRIDVRALGNTTDEQPVDRVDAIYAKP